MTITVTRDWATGPVVLRRLAFALRTHGTPLFGATCRRAGPDDPPADLTLPPRTPDRRLRCPTASLPAARFPSHG